jgi:hypothetical protein
VALDSGRNWHSCARVLHTREISNDGAIQRTTENGMRYKVARIGSIGSQPNTTVSLCDRDRPSIQISLFLNRYTYIAGFFLKVDIYIHGWPSEFAERAFDRFHFPSRQSNEIETNKQNKQVHHNEIPAAYFPIINRK